VNRLAVLFLALVLVVSLTPRAKAQEQLPVKLVSISMAVPGGSDATIAVQTAPGAACRIAVRYGSGPAEASGLRPKTADTKGAVSWTWQVDVQVTAGWWPVTVTCSDGVRQATLETMLVTRVAPEECEDFSS
jgi:hypothetical protein